MGVCSHFAPEHDQLRTSSIVLGNRFSCFNKTVEFCCRIVCRDAPGAMPEQVLTVLEADPDGPETPTEGVFEIMLCEPMVAPPPLALFFQPVLSILRTGRPSWVKTNSR